MAPWYAPTAYHIAGSSRPLLGSWRFKLTDAWLSLQCDSFKLLTKTNNSTVGPTVLQRPEKERKSEERKDGSAGRALQAPYIIVRVHVTLTLARPILLD